MGLILGGGGVNIRIDIRSIRIDNGEGKYWIDNRSIRIDNGGGKY